MKVYSKVGSSLQVIGGDKPVGYIEMLSERPIGDDWVASEDGSWTQYTLTVNDKLQDALVRYNSDLDNFYSQLSAATLSNGAKEEEKKQRIKAAYEARKAEYVAEVEAIKNGG